MTDEGLNSLLDRTARFVEAIHAHVATLTPADSARAQVAQSNYGQRRGLMNRTEIASVLLANIHASDEKRMPDFLMRCVVDSG